MAKRTADNQKTKDDVEEEGNEEVRTMEIFSNRFLLTHDVSQPGIRAAPLAAVEGRP